MLYLMAKLGVSPTVLERPIFQRFLYLRYSHLSLFIFVDHCGFLSNFLGSTGLQFFLIYTIIAKVRYAF